MGCGSSSDDKKDKNGDGKPDTLHDRLPQYVKGEARQTRQENLDARRKQYEMVFTDWLPPGVKGIPEHEKTFEGFAHFVDLGVNIEKMTAEMKWNQAVDLFSDIFHDEDPFDDFEKVYPTDLTFQGIKRDVPTVSKRWRNDEELGRQRLCGFNPLVIKKYHPIPNFPVTDELVEGLLPEGQTLKSLEEADRLYVTDYKQLDGLAPLAHQPPNAYWVAPIALYMVRDDKELVPIAIQLQQDCNQEGNPIFTPKDDKGTWTLVKLFIQQAEGTYHENVYHLMSTHMIMEVFYDACQRQISADHPIHELIEAHFWFTIFINNSARDNLMAPDGQLPVYFPQGFEGMKEMIRRHNNGFDFADYCPREDAIKREVMDIPNYHYRDDAIRLWDCIETFVKNIVYDVYANDDEVRDDTEIQAWAAEFHYKTNWKNLPTKNQKFQTRDQLVKMLTIIINTVSGRHAAVNNGQYDLMGYIPNAPTTVRIPPPKSKDEKYTDMQIAKDALPGWSLIIRQIAFFHGVSTPTTPEKRIGQVPKGFLSYSTEAQNHVKKFQEDLANLSKAIQERNSKLPVPYTYQDPWQVAAGVAI